MEKIWFDQSRICGYLPQIVTILYTIGTNDVNVSNYVTQSKTEKNSDIQNVIDQ